MSDNVISMPASTSMTPDQALDSAKQLDLTECIVIGYDADGVLAVRSSRMKRRDALWLVEQARQWVLNPD